MNEKEIIDRLDGLEEIIAQLTMAYSEVWMVIQSLMSVVLVDKPEEERKEFWLNLEKVRVEMFKEMKRASGPDMEGINSDLARTMENLVTGQSTDPSKQ